MSFRDFWRDRNSLFVDLGIGEICAGIDKILLSLLIGEGWCIY